MSDDERTVGCADIFRCFRMASRPARIWCGFQGVIFSAVVLGLASIVVDFDAVFSEWECCRNFGGGFAPEHVHWVAHWVTQLLLFCVFMFVLLLAHIAWSHHGGAINRSAAVELATGDRQSSLAVSEFSWARCGSYYWPFFAVAAGGGAALAAGCVTVAAAGHVLSVLAVIAGSLASLYVFVVMKQKARSTLTGAVVGLPCAAITGLCAWLLWDVHTTWLGWAGMALAIPVLAVLGIIAVCLILLLIFGRGIMTSTVSFEGSGGVDAVTRAAAYVVRRPWRVLWHWLLAVIFGVPYMALLAALIWAGIECPFAFARSPATVGEVMILLALCGLVAGWGFSFVQCWRVISYALLRQSVDQSGPSEVFLESGTKALVSPERSEPQP